MADKMSREVSVIHGRLFEMCRDAERFYLESVEVNDGVATVSFNGMKFTEVKPKSVGDLTVKLDVDVSEALTGLKAVQREAKKATQALRELEAAQKAVKSDD